jgi:hypothetical protein
MRSMTVSSSHSRACGRVNMARGREGLGRPIVGDRVQLNRSAARGARRPTVAQSTRSGTRNQLMLR